MGELHFCLLCPPWTALDHASSLSRKLAYVPGLTFGFVKLLASSGSHCTKWADEQHRQAGFESRLLPDLPLPFIPTLIGLRAFDLVSSRVWWEAATNTKRYFLKTRMLSYHKILGTILEVDQRRKKQMDQRRWKLMTIHKALHSRDNVDRLYLSRKEGGRMAANIQDRINASIKRFKDYIEQRGGRLITRAWGKRKKTDNKKWEGKQLHGRFKRLTSDIKHEENVDMS